MQITHSLLLNKFSSITAGFTTKQNGNLAFHVNDNLDVVLNNHTMLAKYIKYEKHSLIHMKQIHSNLVHVVNDEDNFINTPTCDALITNKKNIPLMVMVADCSPLLFYDDVQKVIAVAHAGRAGAFSNIVSNMVEKFTQVFHSKPDNIVVSIGPSIGSCCYEVGSEIVQEAKALGLDYAIESRENRYYLNITNILLTQLLHNGVKKENIEISQSCNCCESDTYFSYRAQNITGRFCGFLMLS